MTAAASSLRGVEYSYEVSGAFTLRVPSLDIAPGERVACVGQSGCGKTTLINLMSGVLVPDKGEVLLGETTLSRLSHTERRAQRLSRIGMVFQEFELLDYLSALDNIMLPYRLSGRLGGVHQARKRALELASDLGVRQLLNRKPARLSQGERQRVAVCRALVTGPEIVIADEPTGNLDPDNALGVVDLLSQSAMRTGAALLVVTHNHELLSAFDRVIHLDQLAGTEPVEASS